MNFFEKCHLYFKERFPIKVYFIFILGIYYSSYLFGIRLNKYSTPSTINIKSLVGFLVVLLIFMRLRVFDDYKDYEQDKLKHPERCLSKGQITLLDLNNISWFIISLEIILNLFIGLHSSILWLPILFWSILMLKEFFAPKFLNNHPVIYLISHQLIVPLICIYSMNIGINIFAIENLPYMYLAIFLVGITTLTIIFHLIKKLQHPL